MKISKIFTGLVVCGALMFTGALSSSAQEIDPPKTLAVNYSSHSTLMPHEDWWDVYKGPSYTATVTIQQDPPRVPIVYSGLVFHVATEKGNYLYKGWLSRIN